MKKKIRLLAYLLTVLAFVLVLTNSCKKDEENINTVADIDGNVYHTLTIGTQVWMAENLKTTKFNDGMPIPLLTDTGSNYIFEPGYCWYNDSMAIYKNTYGALYDWAAANTGKICPQGWHVPSFSEWMVLVDDLGSVSVAGGKMKEKDTLHWNSPNTGADDSSGFKALPAGDRFLDGRYGEIGTFTSWWSTNEYVTPNFAWSIAVANNQKWAGKFVFHKNYGLSIRCIKDN